MIVFLPRDAPLEPAAVVGFGRVARALAERLLACPEEQLRELRGVSGDDLFLALGAGETLPWVDGVAYLGRDPCAPRLLVPTAVAPSIPMEAFERAIVRHASSSPQPLAVTATPRRVFSVSDALPISPQRVKAWLEAHP
jgi:hypothetical protein